MGTGHKNFIFMGTGHKNFININRLTRNLAPKISLKRSFWALNAHFKKFSSPTSILLVLGYLFDLGEHL